MTAVRRRLLWVLLIGVALALVVLIARHDEDPIAGLAADDLASARLPAWRCWCSSAAAVLVLFRERFSHGARGRAVLGRGRPRAGGRLHLSLRAARRRRPRDGRVDARPRRARSERTVEIARGRGGDFQVAAQVNGARVAMVLDTGASAVVLTQEAAKAAGLPLEVLSYTVNVDTANGRTRAAPVTLDRLAVGGIVERSVPALIAQPGQLKTSLLGMSFLNRLESWEVRGDKLMMRGNP